ncbi:hypothetical protein TNCV_4622351 [Trichonephila clavipes]|nr:hypothetical protein TNCV_4622351 [Trichonephila clavipes]
MERLILARLNFYLSTNSLLPEEQYGFRRGHSTICDSLPPGEAISSSTRPKSVGDTASDLVFRDNWILTDSLASVHHLSRWTTVGDMTSLNILNNFRKITQPFDTSRRRFLLWNDWRALATVNPSVLIALAPPPNSVPTN